jgi:hypothetical protein
MLPPDLLLEPALEHAHQAEMLMRAHTDLVARFGLGAAPTFKQTLNRVIAEMDAEGALTDRPVESVTDPRKSGL